MGGEGKKRTRKRKMKRKAQVGRPAQAEGKAAKKRARNALQKIVEKKLASLCAPAADSNLNWVVRYVTGKRVGW